MFNELAQLPQLFELEFISAENLKNGLSIGKNSHAYRVMVATRKAVRQFLPDWDVHPHVVTSAGLHYKLWPIEEAGKSRLRYNPCGSEEYIKF